MGFKERGWLVRVALVASLIIALAAPAVSGAGGVVPPATPSITGVVTDADTGAPLEGVEVWLEKDAALSVACFAATVTDASGRYTFSGIPSGYRYWIKVNEQSGHAGYESGLMDYTGALITHDFSLETVPMAVNGVLSRDGVPVKGYKVKLWQDKGDWEEWADYDYTGEDGVFELFTATPGTYFLRVYDCDYNVAYVSDQFSYDGTTTVKMDIDLGAEAPERLADETRYSTAVQIAREGFDPAGDASWPGVDAIVIASGDDGSAPDPLAAAGLCGALDAPLFLVSKRNVPSDVKVAVKEIVAANGPITVYIVGGTASVPDARFYELKQAVGADKLTKVRLAGTDRYSTAAKVAEKVKAVAGAPDVVLVANGADPTKFFDALSLSPVAAAKGYPILLVSAGSVPTPTKRALASMGAGRVIVGGGTGSVSDSVKRQLGAERWAGSTRYSTAATIASKAIAAGWVDSKRIGVAAKLPDALTGGSFCGVAGGVLLLTDGRDLSPATASFIEARDASIEDCFVFGGTASVSAKVQGQICERLALDASGK